MEIKGLDCNFGVDFIICAGFWFFNDDNFDASLDLSLKAKYHSEKNSQETQTPAQDNLKLAEQKVTEGLSAADNKNFSQAIALYTQALELAPNYSVAYYNRGTSNRELKNYQSALDDYNKVIQLTPELWQAYTALALTYFNLQKYDQAIANCNIAIQKKMTTQLLI